MVLDEVGPVHLPIVDGSTRMNSSSGIGKTTPAMSFALSSVAATCWCTAVAVLGAQGLSGYGF
jgi:hypothetical protein